MIVCDMCQERKATYELDGTLMCPGCSDFWLAEPERILRRHRIAKVYLAVFGLLCGIALARALFFGYTWAEGSIMAVGLLVLLWVVRPVADS